MNHSTHHAAPLPIGAFVIAVVAFAAGFALGFVSGLAFIAVNSAVGAALIAVSAYGSTTSSALSRSLYFALLTTVLYLLAVFTTGIPWLSALAMAAVAFVSSIITQNKPIGAMSSLIGTTGYLLLTSFSLLFMRDQSVNVSLMLLALAVGLVAGISVTLIASFVLSKIPRRSKSTPSVTSISEMFYSMKTVTKDFRRAPRDGLRRAAALGVAMYIFASIPAHDGFLLMTTTAIALPVYGRVALLTVGSRLLGSFMAIAIALILPFVLPRPFVSVLALLAIAYALASAFRSATHSLAAACIAFLLLIGAPGNEIGMYAGWRLIDAAGGFLIAWICGYAVWPQQPQMITPIPTDLHRESESVSIRLRDR